MQQLQHVPYFLNKTTPLIYLHPQIARATIVAINEIICPFSYTMHVYPRPHPLLMQQQPSLLRQTNSTAEKSYEEDDAMIEDKQIWPDKLTSAVYATYVDLTQTAQWAIR